jgi:urea carboxylase-associated protein 2
MTSPTNISLHQGQAWSAVLGQGKLLRIEAGSDVPNVAALFYNALQPLDRYNMPDTLKGQHISKLSVGSCLHSDMGHLLASVVDSNVDWHDPLCGLTTAKSMTEKYGSQTFADVRNDFHHNGRDNMLIELAKHGLGKRDLVPNVNFFSKVFAGEDGVLHVVKDHAQQGSFVTLRMEIDCTVILSNTPHPMDDSPVCPGGSIKLTIVEGKPVEVLSDVCIQSRPENVRAWENTQNFLKFRS